MVQREARPLRLLHPSWGLGLKRHGGRTLPTIVVYKPCGLPYFAASQVAACGSGRHLFSAMASNVPVVDTTDVSDSLLSRATDLLPPGSGAPRVVLPLIHPALSRHATASQVNAITAQRKGVTLVACSPDEFMFLRNCHQLQLVRSVYRVLCRVPPCVSARVRHTLRQKNASQLTTKSAFRNPYVQEFFQRSNSATGEVDGIKLVSGSSSSSSSGLPLCAYPYPLLQGGFINVKDRTLLRHGTVSGYLSSHQLPPSVQKIVKRQERLKSLFLSPTMMSPFSVSGESLEVEGGNANEGYCDICSWKVTGKNEAVSHPWIGHECRMCVGLDVKVTPGKELVSDVHEFDNETDILSASCHGEQVEQHRKKNVCRVIGKPFQFDFRLVTLNEACDLALYEVSTNNTSDEEIKAAFAAANFFVLNDFVNDITLSNAMQEVAQQLYTLPQAKLTTFSMASQHLLRHGSPSELVAEPLMLPIDTNFTESLTMGKNPEQQQQQIIGFRGQRYRLLLEALMNLKNERAYFYVAQLALGSGLECTAVHFPDPRHESNISTVQHLLLRMEERGVTEAYRNSLLDRMLFVNCGTTVDCETYNVVLKDNDKQYLPPQRNVAVSWGGGYPAVVRKEECGELVCAYCGASGHVWGTCPEGVPLLPSEVSSSTAAVAESKLNAVGDKALLTTNSELPMKNKASDGMLLTTVDDVTDALEDTRARRKDLDVISIPNNAPTQVFNPHAWRRHHERPVLHQGRLHCAYCSGRHHITQCPRLSGSEAGDYSGRELDKEKLRTHTDKLFCIKCGKRGHLYDSCPSVPRGLHTATHCPICLQSHHNIRHEPSQCPRRVTPPQNYLPTGVPESFVKACGNQRKLGRHGSGALLADSFLSQK